MLTQPMTYAKAIYAGVIAFLGTLATVMVGDVTLGQITQGQWITAALTGLTAAGGVFGITNRPPS